MKSKIYLRKKKDNGRVGYVLETKVIKDDNQRTIYLATLPPLEKVLEWISGKASDELIKEKIEKSLKASDEIKRQAIPEQKETLSETEVRLPDIKRTDAFSKNPGNPGEKRVLTEEENRALWELSK